MCAKSSLPAWSIEASEHRKWFDGWRIVTGVLAVTFLVGSFAFFGEVDDEERAGAECEAEGGEWCEWADWSDVYTIFGWYLLAVAGCFGLATLARQGSGERRVFTGIGTTLVYLPTLVITLAVAENQAGPDLAWALLCANAGIALVALLYLANRPNSRVMP